jgi:hypothetical protein
MDWVALTDFYHESKCLLYYRLDPKTERINDYIENTCHCPSRQQRHLKATGTSSSEVISMNNHSHVQTLRASHNNNTNGNEPTTAAQQPIARNINVNPPPAMELDTSKIIAPTTAVQQKTTSSLQHVNKNGDVHVTHHDNGRRGSMADLPLDILNAVNALTQVDQKLYKLALERFLREIAWLEMQLGHRVLCDHVLNRWDPELAYLNVSVTAMYRNVKKSSGIVTND